MIFLILLIIMEGCISSIINPSVNDTSLLKMLSIIFVFINTFAFIFIAQIKSKKNKDLFYILFLSYFLHIVFMFWDIYCSDIFMLPGSGADTGSFHNWAMNYALNNAKASGYSLFVGVIYKLFGIQPIIVQYINVILAMATIIITSEILDEFKIKENIKKLSISIIAFIPNYLILSSILLRESLLIFLLASSLFYFIKWWKHNIIKYFILSLIFSFIATWLHSGAIANVIAYSLAFILCRNKKRKFKVNFSTVFFSIIFVVLFMFIYNQFGKTFFGYFNNIESVSDITNKASNGAYGGSAYSIGSASDDSLFSLIIYSPIRMFYFLTSPLPWQWRGANDIIAFLFSAMFYVICIIKSIEASKCEDENKNFIIFGLLLALISAFIFGWGVSNAGTALRHRDKFLVNYLVMLSVSWQALSRQKNTKGLKE